jgi:hypothetical protein
VYVWGNPQELKKIPYRDAKVISVRGETFDRLSDYRMLVGTTSLDATLVWMMNKIEDIE